MSTTDPTRGDDRYAAVTARLRADFTTAKADALRRLADPDTSVDDADTYARAILPHLNTGVRWAKLVSLRLQASLLARLECAQVDPALISVRLPGEDRDAHLSREIGNTRRVLASLIDTAVRADEAQAARGLSADYYSRVRDIPAQRARS